FVISMEDNGDFKSLERFLPDYRPVEPIDIKFGPNGDLYVLEYGGRWFQYSPEARLVRIAFEGGNRQPIVVAKSDKKGGVPPFEVSLSSAGTEDYDNDDLSYRWEIVDAGGNVQVKEEPNPTVTLTSIGTYNARLTVTDPSGASDSVSLPIVSGNEPPKVSIQFRGNRSFFFPGAPVEYAVEVVDAEDGTFSKGDIDADKITFSIDQVDSNFDVESLRQMPLDDAATSRFPVAQSIIAKANCRSCHLVDAKLVGPAFKEIAAKYKDDENALDDLAGKVVGGGRGVWGEVPMPPNALLTEDEAKQILKYVLSLADDGNQGPALVGAYTPVAPAAPQGRGGFGRGPVDPGAVLMRAVYKDAGDDLAASLTSQTIELLRSATLQVSAADVLDGIETGRFGATVSKGSHAVFKNIDLTQVKQLDVMANVMARSNHTGGTIEVRLGGPKGELLGAATLDAPEPPQGGGRRGFGGFRRDPVYIAIREVSGKKDLCLIFRNDAAEDGANLMSVSSITFSAEVTENKKADGPNQNL
ncbi:MAG: PKD domain-containing protein, partial [Verrucomicrobia bacterium]|nr:PKD domain-containing protein [Verrucomicrobiota bacterium]